MAATSASMSDFRLTRTGPLRWYRATASARRGFCADCGSILFWQADASPDRISITAGTLDGPTGLKTEGHIFCADRGDYYVIPDEGYRRDGWA
jgi:hypothetical protein